MYWYNHEGQWILIFENKDELKANANGLIQGQTIGVHQEAYPSAQVGDEYGFTYSTEATGQVQIIEVRKGHHVIRGSDGYLHEYDSMGNYMGIFVTPAVILALLKLLMIITISITIIAGLWLFRSIMSHKIDHLADCSNVITAPNGESWGLDPDGKVVIHANPPFDWGLAATLIVITSVTGAVAYTYLRTKER